MGESLSFVHFPSSFLSVPTVLWHLSRILRTGIAHPFSYKIECLHRTAIFYYCIYSCTVYKIILHTLLMWTSSWPYEEGRNYPLFQGGDWGWRSWRIQLRCCKPWLTSLVRWAVSLIERLLSVHSFNSSMIETQNI